MIASPERNYYTMSEAMVRHGTIPGIHRVEGSWVVDIDDLHVWLNRHANA